MKLNKNSETIILIGGTTIIGILIIQILHTNTNIIGIIAILTFIGVIMSEYYGKQKEKKECKKKQKKN